MKLAHNIKLSVFCSEEDSNKTKQTLLNLCPFKLEQEKIQLKESTAKGFKEKKIRILEILLKKEKHTSRFLKQLKTNLPEEQKNLLQTQAESRLDLELNFFIRLDKPKLLKQKFQITDSGDCFHIKISIAAYPSKRDVALKIIKDWLN